MFVFWFVACTNPTAILWNVASGSSHFSDDLFSEHLQNNLVLMCIYVKTDLFKFGPHSSFTLQFRSKWWLCATCGNASKFCFRTTRGTLEFHTISSKYFPIQHWPIGLLNRGMLFSEVQNESLSLSRYIYIQSLFTCKITTATR